MPVKQLMAMEYRDYIVINRLVMSCFKNIHTCEEALIKVHNYQKNSESNNKFSCQTRLLGLEANLIKAMNFNLKRHETKSIINDVRKYCYCCRFW